MRAKFLIPVLLVLSMVLPAAAQDAPPMPPPDLGSGEVVIEGLNNPIGVFVASDGAVWVTDGGVGGENPIQVIVPGSEGLVESNYGDSARVLRWTGSGEPEVVAMLPSVVAGMDLLGPAHLAEVDGEIYVALGFWIEAQGEEVTIPNFSQLVRLTEGGAEPVADLWAYELENNPDQTLNLESHPYGVDAGPDGTVLVTDAAANTLYSVNPETGDVTTLAVFDPLPNVFPNPLRNNELLGDPVPTNVVYAEDGTIYVSYLSPFPFIPGSAKVVAVAEDGTVSDFATNLTMLTDLKMGPDGNLYATQYGIFGEQGPEFNSGGVVRILPDGSSELVIGGLPFVTGVDFDADGNGYVLINGVGIPGIGALVRYEGLTDMPGMPMADMMGGAMPEATPETTPGA